MIGGREVPPGSAGIANGGDPALDKALHLLRPFRPILDQL
jgi:hypothetical protein